MTILVKNLSSEIQNRRVQNSITECSITKPTKTEKRTEQKRINLNSVETKPNPNRNIEHQSNQKFNFKMQMIDFK